MNLPNLITSARIALVPLFLVLLILAPSQDSWQRLLALLVFVLAISTDGIDGMIARKTNRVTNLGKILDPIADKALIGSALITLSIMGEVQWWITSAILLREVVVTAYRLVVVKQKVIAASALGKIKTIFQGIAIGVVLAPFEVWFSPWQIFEQLLLLIALAITLVSGIQYMKAALR